jgi:hypothetical protein
VYELRLGLRLAVVSRSLLLRKRRFRGVYGVGGAGDSAGGGAMVARLMEAPFSYSLGAEDVLLRHAHALAGEGRAEGKEGSDAVREHVAGEGAEGEGKASEGARAAPAAAGGALPKAQQDACGGGGGSSGSGESDMAVLRAVLHSVLVCVRP